MRVQKEADLCTKWVFINLHRSSKYQLLNLVADALIYWSLRETDPDTNPKKLLTRTQIAEKIQDIFPTAKTLLLPQLNERLVALSKKTPTGLERLRYYNANDSFCLPLDMRSIVAGEAVKVMSDQDAFMKSCSQRIQVADSTLNATVASQIAEIVFHTVHRHFVEQGLLLTAFLEKKTDKLLKDQIVEEEMLRVLQQKNMGAIAEPVLTELFTHLHGVDLEFRNHYAPAEQYIKESEISECNRILIRT